MDKTSVYHIQMDLTFFLLLLYPRSSSTTLMIRGDLALTQHTNYSRHTMAPDLMRDQAFNTAPDLIWTQPKAKTSLPPRKAFSAGVCPFHAKTSSTSDETTANATSMLACFPAARLTVISCISCSVFLMGRRFLCDRSFLLLSQLKGHWLVTQHCDRLKTLWIGAFWDGIVKF